MRLKLLLLLGALTLLLFVVGQVWTLWIQPEVMTDAALKQMERSNQPTRWVRAANHFQQWLDLGGFYASWATAAMLALWGSLGRRRRPDAEHSSATTDKEMTR